MPDSIDTSSPAWDPSSRTPNVNDDNDSTTCADNDTTSQVMHPILDACGIKMKVTANSGFFNSKEMVASVESLDCKLVVRRVHYNAEQCLEPR
jgi:hypothetical protein